MVPGKFGDLMTNLDTFRAFYKGKRVLLTGHTGFKGSWLAIWLYELGAEVIGVSLEPYTERDNFVLSGIGKRIVDLRGDIRDGEKMKQIFQQYRPEIVFHLAAQPIVRLSYEIPVETYETNVMGTIRILEAMRNTPDVKVGVMITTDKCYENNKEQIWGYRENEPLGGYDPYSSSKGAAEIAIASWRRSFCNPETSETVDCQCACRQCYRRRGLGVGPDCARLHKGVGSREAHRNPESSGSPPLAACFGTFEWLSVAGDENVGGTYPLL